MSIFGNTQQNKQTGGGGLFGASATQNTGGSSLFGSNNANTNTGGSGLFGASSNQPSAGGGLFGSSTAQQPSTGGSLFGANNTTQQNTAGGGLFPSSNAAQQTNTTQQTNTSSGLFGSNNAAAGTGGPLFGGQSNGARLGQTGGGSSSLLGGNTQQQPSLFGASATQSQQPQQQPQSTSVYQPGTVSVGNMGHTMTQAQLQRLQFSGVSTQPNEKSIAEQIRTIMGKWDPESDTTILKTYLYNAVPKEYAPFFYPNAAAGEDEKSWEEALSQKPEPPKVDGKEVDSTTYVPILVKGFKALGERAETQATVVQQMRARLHEMNNSLTSIMAAHEQRITANIARAKRQHQVLQQKCLRLSVKVQVLRNRGYALDAAEEGLRKTLMGLEKQVMDPGFLGREDEIWARMIALKEKARWLEEEGKWVNAQVQQQQQQRNDDGTSSAVPEDVLAKTRKILKDYDGQLQHLNKELEDVRKEFAEWERSRR
ncbi:hypothetical protein M409DRAFT_59618 [Zasmidium cellare ATCC 36951]|uniref:Nucleoporin Nup54 alpha-helical domain-containing protein n=1 Tax=Zasmidium cellare ATCC 36951 TaxID=1080233 RepID=A0A6A6C613_ZASCE|nr:uncharacterized protein M409DRAFT_59618 [Zasmidium cellare ATCC 36951]KAF2160826.1 hypothetical protein M409DRAFT_59618 [Zasmidium cellare ATCC 36951]